MKHNTVASVDVNKISIQLKEKIYIYTLISFIAPIKLCLLEQSVCIRVVYKILQVSSQQDTSKMLRIY